MTDIQRDLEALLFACSQGTGTTGWLILADALEEAGRQDEADLIRSDRNCEVADGIVVECGDEDEDEDDESHSFTYRVAGESEELDADDMDEAVSEAEDLCRDGDWGEEGASIEVTVIEYDADGDEVDRRDFTVEIEPNHSEMISRATRGAGCGDDPDDHDWTSEGEGGCRENPGVWATGGTSMMFRSHCRTCGLRRTEYSCGSQRNPGDHDSVSYEMPDNWCEEMPPEVLADLLEECGAADLVVRLREVVA